MAEKDRLLPLGDGDGLELRRVIAAMPDVEALSMPLLCVFCRRVEAGDYDGTDVASVVSFEPLNPVTPGHRLFIPREHTESALRRPDLAGQAFDAAARHGKAAAIACNLITSAGAEATQTVKHLHVHYVPRREGDGLRLPWTGQNASRCPNDQHCDHWWDDTGPCCKCGDDTGAGESDAAPGRKAGEPL